MKTKTVLIQEQLLNDLTVSISQYNKKNKPKLKLDVAVFYISLFNSIPSYYREEEQSDIVSLNSQRLKHYHAKYNIYIKFLENGFIQKVKSYGADIHESNSFRLSEKYSKNTLKLFHIQDKALLKKFDEKGRDSYEKEKMKICLNERPQLVKYFDEKLTINIKDALNEIKILGKHDKTNRKFLSNMTLIKEFYTQEWKYSMKPKSDNRLHTNLTRCSKVLRKHLLYDGERIIGVDLKTSQPYFLCVLIKAILQKDKKLLEQVKATNIISQDTIEQLFNLDLDKDELIRFVLSVLNNDFYHEFEKILTISYDENGLPYRMVSNFKSNKKHKSRSKQKGIKEAKRKITYKTSRELVKEVVMEIFYSKPRTTVKEAKMFRDKYPSVQKIFLCLYNNDVKFSYLLQYIEAYVLMDYTAKKIHEKHPEMPLFSIHDALVTNKKWITVLEREMYLSIKEVTTINPKLELEDWSDSIIDNNDILTPNVASF